MSAASDLRGIPWLGGKAGTQTAGAFIASRLPDDAPIYGEPFFGMGGILLRRKPAHREIVNDIDGRLVNWWRVVRDQPAELARLIAATPDARAEFEWAIEAVKDETETPLRRALAFTIRTQQAYPADRGADDSNCHKWYPHLARRDGHAVWTDGLETRIPALARRLRAVKLERMDAIDFIERYGALDGMLLYLDPPYEGTRGYENAVDRERLREAVLASPARIAISGYGGEWDGLGWRKETRRSSATTAVVSGGEGRRMESLWMNFTPAQERLL